MAPQKYYSRQNAKKGVKRSSLILIILVASLLIGYQYRETLYAYWEKDKLPVSGAGQEEEPEQNTNEPEQGDEEEVPSPYPPQAGEILHIEDGNYLLALVTKQTSLGDYEPNDLVTIPVEMRLYDSKYQLRQEAYLHLREMWEAARAAGTEFFVNSAFRSYATQKRIFNNYVAQNGEEKANEFSARPGQSEHQLGTTVDLGIPGYALSAAFGGTSPGQWLHDNAYKYGFVMSYPEGTQEITGYIYEPWHFRYLGVEKAKEWHDSNLVLCQFLEQQPQQWQQN